jgi:phosphomannomutase
VAECKSLFPCSEETNFEVQDVAKTIAYISNHYRGMALNINQTNGMSMEFENWRFNLRDSSTEALLRLNLETRRNTELVDEKTGEIAQIIGAASL